MTEFHFIVELAPKGGLVARVVGVDNFTEVDSIEETHAQVCDAERCHLDEGLGTQPDPPAHHPRRSAGDMRIPRPSPGRTGSGVWGGLVMSPLARPAAISASPPAPMASITSPSPGMTRCASAPWRQPSTAWRPITA